MSDFHFWYTLGLIILMNLFLIKEIIDPDVVIFSTLIALVAGGVIGVRDAFAGFANPGMLTVGFLFIVAAAMQNTGILEPAGRALLGKKGSLSARLLRFLFPVSALSAFFNNTPIVAMLIPIVRTWAKRNDVAVSKLMIPLSYATILGGTCTLIGTSTNLVVHGLMLENGIEGMSLFEISRVGVPVAVIGLLVISLAGHRFLPQRKEPLVELGEKTREFVIEMKVEHDYRHVYQTIEAAGLRHLKGLYLFQIERQHAIIAPVGPQERIQPGDRLFFTGLPETIVDLQKTPGLSLLEDKAFDLKNYDSDALGIFEVVVSAKSFLIGKNVRESNFRSHYNAVILAIHRSGERIRKKIGDIVLRPGDTLLIMSQPEFLKQWYHSNDFYLVSKRDQTPSKPKRYAVFSLAVMLLMVLAMALNLLPILITVCIAALLLIFGKCITPSDARKSVDFSVLLTIASAFGLSRALIQSGVADFIAQELISLGRAGVSHRAGHGSADATGPAPVFDRHHPGRVRQFCHADRLSDQPDGVWPGRVQVSRLSAFWSFYEFFYRLFIHQPALSHLLLIRLFSGQGRGVCCLKMMLKKLFRQ